MNNTPRNPWKILDVADIGSKNREGYTVFISNGKQSMSATLWLPKGIPATGANFRSIATPLALNDSRISPQIREALQNC